MRYLWYIFASFIPVVSVISVVNAYAEDSDTTKVNGEIRGVWMELRSTTQKEGIVEIRETITKLKAAGLNTIFIWCSTSYIAALSDTAYRQLAPQASWDALGLLLREAHTASLQVHAWYSPWRYKETFRAVELLKHPEWAIVDSSGKPNTFAICASRIEARRFETETVLTLLRHYPDLDGLHLEEPGYPGGPYCFCDACRTLGWQLFGYDIKRHPDDDAISTLKAFSCTDLLRRLRNALKAIAPHLLLSANGSSDITYDLSIGRDWSTWVWRGYIDFYVPQIYTSSLEEFQRYAIKTLHAANGACPVVMGILTSYTPIPPKRNSPDELIQQIETTKKLGARGVILFNREYLRDDEITAIASSLKKAEKKK